MFVALLGMDTLVKRQPLNAESPIVRTLLPITTFVRAKQLSNALLPMFSKLSGSVIARKEVQKEKSELPMLRRPLPKVTLVSWFNPRKTELPMLVILSGITTLVMDDRPLKAELLMAVTG
jgi:hypothetical protein